MSDSDLVNRVQAYSKASHERLEAFRLALLRLDELNIEGDVVECGVWKGGHIILARMISPSRLCWLYDTFSGMTAPGPYDRKVVKNKPPPDKSKKKSWTMASLDEVVGNLAAEGVYDSLKLKFVVGDVCKTLLDAKNVPQKIAMLRLDTDWYESTKIELEVLFPRLVDGGILIVDDYGHWQGARKATDDYLGSRKEGLQAIDYTAVMLVRTA